MLDGFNVQIIFLLILFIAPLLGPSFISFFCLLTNKDIPPFLPQINSSSFSTALVAFIAVVTLATEVNKAYILINFLVLFILVCLLMALAYIEKAQKDTTNENTTFVLKDKSKIQLKADINFADLEKLAQQFIDVDFFPNSIPNRFSKYPRQKRRQFFVDLVNKYFSANGNDSNLKQTDFLVPQEKQKSLESAYITITIFSVIFYFTSILVYFFTTRK